MLALRVQQLAERHPERTFAVQGETGAAVSWAEHAARVGRLGAWLHAAGVREGDKVIVLGYNCYEWLLGRDAAWDLGAYSVPVNWHLAPPEIAYSVGDSDAGTLIVDAAFLPALAAARGADPLQFAHLQRTLVWGAGADAALPSGAVSLAAAEAAGARLPHAPPPPRLGRSMLYTGGTSGKPKAVVYPGTVPGQPTGDATSGAALLGPAGIKWLHENHVHLVAAPLYHAAPNIKQGQAQGQGASTVLMRRFDTALFYDLVRRHRVTTVVMPPILVKRLADAPPAPGEDLSSLRWVAVVGAPCPAVVKRAALARGLPLHEMYGSSELGVNAVMPPEDMLARPSSCGRLVRGVRARIVADDGSECPAGTPGLLYIQKSVEYYKAPQKSKEARLPADPRFATVGDVAYMDAEGYLYICDRKIDMIISGGANIYPAEVEQVLFQHPAVADVAVFGVPDEEYGERVHAAVLLKEGAALSPAELKAWARDRIAPYKLPREVSYPSDFPRTPAGKVLKRSLKERLGKQPAARL
eukprot:TRINITY_DN9005_c0_g1_i2.p1 TRINITY_DN9005_c0_g1~~TRINITY_DN9005_c0_g1_i2.p1  ORF type:complete len:556 (+),score=174.82 TRINITY_DN9005_c0_g1_i2:91-1668(+)